MIGSLVGLVTFLAGRPYASQQPLGSVGQFYPPGPLVSPADVKVLTRARPDLVESYALRKGKPVITTEVTWLLPQYQHAIPRVAGLEGAQRIGGRISIMVPLIAGETVAAELDCSRYACRAVKPAVLSGSGCNFTLSVTCVRVVPTPGVIALLFYVHAITPHPGDTRNDTVAGVRRAYRQAVTNPNPDPLLIG